MLSLLEVRNYVLIDSLKIAFPEGLVIISGQTGAGKSILLGALSLLMGAKADASLISEGADSCVVEGEFSSPDPALKAIVEDAGAEWTDGSLILRRVVSASGRSRAFVNDCPFPVGSLPALCARLIDIHSQHQTLQLFSPGYQIELLDHFAGCTELRHGYSGRYAELQALRKSLASLNAEAETLGKEREFNSAQLAQLVSAGLRDGEVEELEEEHSRLSHAEEIRQLLSEADGALNPPGEDYPSATTSLKEASRALEKLAAFIPSCTELSDRLDSARLEVSDINDEIESLASGVEASPERLSQVESRMSLLYDLMAKHGCSGIAELIAVRDRYASLVSDTDSLSERIAEAEKAVGEWQERLSETGRSLTAARRAASEAFSSSVQKMLRSLELPSAVFRTEISAAKPSAAGEDSVSFLFSSTGRNAVPLASCASGGEMSRIMLCLKAMMARFVAMPTMIFDEIDTGVSGSAADRMGSMICSMGEDMQVFAITHLPQVAAKGNAHYLVSKTTGPDGRVVSSISRLGAEERVAEIARMLSGSTVTEAAIANARELLGQSISS